MVAPNKKHTVDLTIDLGERLDQIDERLDAITKRMNQLIELLTEKPDVVGDGSGWARRPEATPSQLHELYLRRAKAMRQGKAAKKLGISRAQFVERYGDIDYAPADALPSKDDPRQESLPQTAASNASPTEARPRRRKPSKASVPDVMTEVGKKALALEKGEEPPKGDDWRKRRRGRK